MRKRYRVLFFAALVAALVVPVGYALSIESAPGAGTARHAALAVPAVAPAAQTPAAAPVTAPIVTRTSATVLSSLQVSDAAKLFGIGAVLFGLAAAVRKAV